MKQEAKIEGGGTEPSEAKEAIAGESEAKAAAPLTAEEQKAKDLKRLKRKRYQENKKKKWFDPKVNPYIYVDGLPEDATEEELSSFFKKCGIIKLDPRTGEESIKLYRDQLTGLPKGDARICFAKVESVDTAIQMLDGAYLRPEMTSTIRVCEAQFQQKGEEYMPRKVQKTDKLMQMKIKNKQESKLQVGFEEDFAPIAGLTNADEANGDHHVVAGVKDTGPKIVILEGIFTLDEVQESLQADQINEDQFFQDLEQDVQMQLENEISSIAIEKKTIGHKASPKLNFFRLNPKGVVKIRFSHSTQAE